MTRVIQVLRHLPYKDRLKHINLHSLHRQSVRGDLSEVLKWAKLFNKEEIVKVPAKTRSNVFKLDRYRFKKDIGWNRFTNNVVNEWSRISRQVSGVNPIKKINRLGGFTDEDEKVIQVPPHWRL